MFTVKTLYHFPQSLYIDFQGNLKKKFGKYRKAPIFNNRGRFRSGVFILEFFLFYNAFSWKINAHGGNLRLDFYTAEKVYK